MRDHIGEVNCVIINGDHLYSSSFDKTIKVHINLSLLSIFNNLLHVVKIWSASTFNLHTTLEGHDKAVNTLLIVDHFLFSGSNDGIIMVCRFLIFFFFV